MAGINRVMLIGHLGETPELSFTDNRTPVTSFPLATSELISKQGTKEEITEWHNIVVWRGLAEMAARLLRQGHLIYLEGKLSTRKFTDSSQVVRYTTEVIAEKFTLLGRKSDFTERQSATNLPGDVRD